MFVYLLALALLPTILLMIFIYYKDSHEKEPVGLLASLFFLGVLSTLPAAILEVFGEIIVLSVFEESSFMYNFLIAFFVVALAEEGGKFIFTYIRTWNNRNFNFKFDGIEYCVFVSLGFATLENILYIVEGGLLTAIMRAILSVPSHAIDAVFMGYFYGNAKACDSVGDKQGRNKNLIFSVIIAVFLHGFYDFCLFMENPLTIILFLVFVVVMDIIAFYRIHVSSKHNQEIFRKNYNNIYGNVYVPVNQMNYYNVPSGYSSYNQPMQPQNYPRPGMPPYTSNQRSTLQASYPPNQQALYTSQQQTSYQPQRQTPYQVPCQVPNQTTHYPASDGNTGAPRNSRGSVRMIYCTHCGNLCNSEMFYCTSCGTPLHR